MPKGEWGRCRGGCTPEGECGGGEGGMHAQGGVGSIQDQRGSGLLSSLIAQCNPS